jgi:hypothetical protein
MVNRRNCGPFGLVLLALLVLAAIAPSGVAAAELLDALRGRWAPAPATAPTMEWQPDGEGFTLTWASTGSGEVSARFLPTGRPGVFAGRGAGEWTIFGGDAPVNPLVDGTLLWARTTVDTAYVYSLAIDDQGGFILERYTCRPAGDRLSVAVLRWTAKGQANDAEQTLVRVEQ